jgi:hypothetical protein
MTDLRDLVRRMADALDHYQQVLAHDLSKRQPLATEARAALAEVQVEGEGPRPMTDWRALCKELVDVIGTLVGGVHCGHYNQRHMWECRRIVERAHAALIADSATTETTDD